MATAGAIGAGTIADAMRAGAVVRVAVASVGLAVGTRITAVGAAAGVGAEPGAGTPVSSLRPSLCRRRRLSWRPRRSLWRLHRFTWRPRRSHLELVRCWPRRRSLRRRLL